MTEFPERRVSPLARQLALLVGFLALLVVAVLTVLVPELTDDEATEGDPASASGRETPPD